MNRSEAGDANEPGQGRSLPLRLALAHYIFTLFFFGFFITILSGAALSDAFPSISTLFVILYLVGLTVDAPLFFLGWVVEQTPIDLNLPIIAVLAAI